MGSGNTKVIDIDLADISNTAVHCLLPESGLLSLTEVAINCDSVAVFAVYVGGEIYLIDPVDCSRSYYCTIPHSIGEHFQGTSPNFMFMEPEPCKITLDLDLANRTTTGIDYIDTFFCKPPDPFLLSLPNLFSDKPWDSLVIWIEAGPPAMTLDGNTASYAAIQGKLTQRLHYSSTGMADFSALSSQLTSLLIAGPLPEGYSDMKIGFCGFADYLISDTAYAYITIVGRTTHAGLDSTLSICTDAAEFDLNTLRSSGSTNGGEWIAGSSFNPQEDLPGFYYYIVDDPYCTSDSAIFDIGIFTTPIFDLGPDRLLCPGDSTFFNLSLSNADIWWSDGSRQPMLIVIEPGAIWVEVTDINDCHYSDSVMVLVDDACLLDQLYLPNIFSPDGNGINDTWGLAAGSGIDQIEIQIYDRWGNGLFANSDGSMVWDGTTNRGTQVPSGIYVYLIKVTLPSGSVYIRRGDITVVR